MEVDLCSLSSHKKYLFNCHSEMDIYLISIYSATKTIEADYTLHMRRLVATLTLCSEHPLSKDSVEPGVRSLISPNNISANDCPPEIH